MRRGRIGAILKPSQLIINICGGYTKENAQVLTSETIHANLSLHSKIIKQLTKMKQTAAHYNLSYLTANQSYLWHKMFVIHRNLDRWSSINYNQAQDYDAYINPILIPSATPPIFTHQKCTNFPGLHCHVMRYETIKVQYRNEERKQIEQEAEGFRATVLQHCLSHLQGKILLDEDIGGTRIEFDYPLQELLKKTKFLVDQYSFRIKVMMSQNVKTDSQQFKRVKKQYLSRIQQTYIEEVNKMDEQIYGKQ